MITDHLGRSFKKLRVSLTSQCNFACLYCAASDHDSPLQKPLVRPNATKELSAIELANLIKAIHQKVNLTSIRLTGGEPLLNPNVVDLVRQIRLMGISDIRLTTNGFLLPQYLDRLKIEGLTSVNISIDAVSESTFNLMARRNGLNQVVKGIDNAIENGLKVKLNAVIMKGRNDHEIVPLLNFANSRKVVIRFLELMPMGPMHHQYGNWFFSQDEILNSIATHHQIEKIQRIDSSTANYWQVNNGQVFGIIANESAPFCGDCNRLRLDSFGKIYGCLSSAIGHDLIKVADNDLQLNQTLTKALNQKQLSKFVGSTLSMQTIGG